jgi:hypothetical protein
MVSALLVTLALLASAPEPTTLDAPSMRAVVRVIQGRVSVTDTGAAESRPAYTGLLLRGGAIVETGTEGWAELHVLGAGRVRLSASTRIALGEKGLRVVSGRAWLDHSDGIDERTWDVELPFATCRVARSTSAIIEHGARTGSTVVVRRGLAVLEEEGAEALEIRPGQIASVAVGSGRSVAVRAGGVGLAELSELEASAVLGDLAGVRRFLLDRVASANVRPGTPRRLDEVLRSTPELGGVSATEWDLESALKPPAFFENEVPPKGPNVRVEVGFDED